MYYGKNRYISLAEADIVDVDCYEVKEVPTGVGTELISSLTGDTNAKPGTVSGTYQTITATWTGSINSITVRTVNFLLIGTNTITVSVYTGANGNTGTLLGQETVTLTGGTVSDQQIDFTTPIIVNNGSQYSLFLESSNAGFIFFDTVDDVYAGGAVSTDATADVAFSISGFTSLDITKYNVFTYEDGTQRAFEDGTTTEVDITSGIPATWEKCKTQISGDALQTLIFGSDDKIFAMPSITKKYCAGGEINTLQTGLPNTNSSTFEIQYSPNNSHSSSEIELILQQASGTAPFNYGNLEIVNVTDGGAVIATSDNDFTLNALNTEVPANYTFATPVQFEAGKEYLIQWTSPTSQGGYKRLPDYNPCLPLNVDVAIDQTPAIRIEGATSSYSVYVSEYYNSDGSVNKLIALNGCTQELSEITIIDPSWEDCNCCKDDNTSNSNITTDYGVTGDGTSANPLKLEVGVARVTVNSQAGINNSTAGVNVSFGATTIDTIGVTTGGGGIVLPTGLYEIEFRPTIVSFVQRSNIGWRILLDGTAQLAGGIGGMNYARAQSSHNETGDFIKDFVEITNPTGVVTIQGFRQAEIGANVNLVGNASILLIKRLA